ncbi:serine hydrolase [Telluribacter sp. SYSU D00476]|uniref:serine hydrolase domain-containing protein n=1 Tax=Telluribacter sp. SYSU D00476 TaxID=2811430 RepID=UPI001FF29839|nr:serine hydrolase domain-containing protein [Telluribacter sp. SYSU D00476]
MKQIILFLGLLLSSGTIPVDVRAQPLVGVPTARMDSLFKDWTTTQSPGAVLAIVKDGQIVYRKAYGMANVAAGEKLTPHHAFWVASMTKQFTAMSIALLAENGKLSVEDDIRKHLPELPYLGDTVRIRHLIHHTSGLRDGFTLIGLTFRGEKHYTSANVIRMLKKQSALNFKPGKRYEYNNGGYVLLAEIVARVSGMPFDSYVASHIFQPLGMTQSRIISQLDNKYPNLARGYESTYKKGRPTYKRKHFKGNTYGSTGLVTTVDDLIQWDANFYRNRLGKGNQELIKQVMESGLLNDGTHTAYAYGLEVVDQDGVLTVSHSGADPGYKAEMVRFPEHRLTLICLANTGNMWSLTQKLLLMGEWMIKGETHLPAAHLTKASPAPVTDLDGIYLHPQNKADIRFVSETDGQLFASASMQGYKVPLVPTGTDCYQNRGLKVNRFQFERSESGQVTGLTIYNRDQQLSLQKVQPQSYQTNELKALAGKYYSPELDHQYRLKVRKGKLVMSIYGLINIPLLPLEKYRFAADLMGNNSFEFQTDAAGSPTGFTFSRAAVTNLHFKKIK